MRFQVVLHFDPEYNGYVADVPELNGCMSQGKTIDEALMNIKDAIKGWLEVEKELDRTYEESHRPVFLSEVFV
jgi:predicted RNase H-like HicB family nuclease